MTQDEDAYVRKTAVLNIAKLYEHEREIVNDHVHLHFFFIFFFC